MPAQPPTRHGILIVHGIGNQRQSDILLDVGEPLFDWLQHWYAARSDAAWVRLRQRNAQQWWWRRRAVPSPDDAPPAALPDLRQVILNFDPVDRGAANHQSAAIITLPDRREWVLAETWWAASLRRQPFGEMLIWTSRHLLTAGGSLVQNAWDRLIGQGQDQDKAPLHPAARVSLTIYYQATLILYALALVIGFIPLLLLLLLAQVPFSPLRSSLYNLVGTFLEVNLGEFRSMFEDAVQSANMRRRVADAVTNLAYTHGCTEVTIVAHSGGAVVCFDMLTDPRHRTVAAAVTKLITVGSGLNKAWQIAPELARLHGPLPDHLHWTDIWGTLDPAPTGPLVPPPDPTDRHRNVRVFQPSEAVRDTQRLVERQSASAVAPGRTRRQAEPTYWPASARCTNELSIITDHWVYWRNDEQALARIVAEIDRPYYRDSPFWCGAGSIDPLDREEYASPAEAPLRRGVQRRKLRVVALAWARLAVVAGWLILAARWAAWLADWLYLHRNTALPLPGSMVGLLVWADQQFAQQAAWLMQLAQPLPAGLAARDAVLVVMLGAAAVILVLYGLDKAIWPRRADYPRQTQRWRQFVLFAFTAASCALYLAPLMTIFLPLLAAHPLFWTIAAVLLGLAPLFFFNLVRLCWATWDARARARVIAAIATGKERTV